ncbi:MAG: hypothetical protein ACI8WB_003857, partial [Phenylobacterium sp.]
MEQESITAWFSYAGQQHSLVVGICDWLKPAAAVAVITQAIEQAVTNKEASFEQVRLAAKRYRLDDDDNAEPIYRLPPGGAISELALDIAKSPMRFMLLSDAYFQSQPCLNEFCLSLCANDTGDNKLPMLIMVGFEDVTKVLSDGEFAFANAIENSTLLEALTTTHQALSKEMTNKRGFDLSAGFRSKLPEIVKTLSGQVFSTAEQDIDAEKAKSLAIDMYRYSFRYLASTGCSAHQDAVEGLYNKWCKGELAAELVEKLDHSFNAIKDDDDAQVFLNSVYQLLKNTHSICARAQTKRVILELYGLVIFKLLRPIGASLLTAFKDKDNLINVYVDDDTACSFENAIHAALSYCATQGLTPRITQSDGTNNAMVDGMVFSRQLTISGSGQSELLFVFQQLMTYMRPFDERLISDKQLKDKKLIRFFRAGLKNIKSGQYGVLVLDLHQSRDKNGYHRLLEKLESTINEGYETKLSIPCVVLRSETTPSGEFGNTMLFSPDAF